MLIGSVAATLAILPDGVEVAIVSFNHEVQTVSPVVRLDDTSRSQLLKAIEPAPGRRRRDRYPCSRKTGDLELSGARGSRGHVIVFSDGAQTGYGNVAWHESQWGPVAGNLTRTARQKSVLIQTLGLGLESQAEGSHAPTALD